MTGTIGERRYSAFISYRHHPVDRFNAIRLMRALEGFSTPRGLRKQGYPAKLDPVFRDDDEAGAHGTLSAQLREALTNSKVLIVICTSRTPESEWVKREIEFFQQIGRGDFIIPVVVEGEPSQVVPATLADGGSGWSSNELLAVDLRERPHEPAATTWRRGILRIAAALLECRYDDLVQRAETERRRALFQRGAIVGGGVAFLSLLGLFWWDATLRVKQQYFADYVEHWGVPVGVGPLTGDEVRHRSENARISTQGGRVIEFARVNGLGGLRAGSGSELIEPWADEVARWTYLYRNDGTLASATAFDESDREVRKLTFDFSPDRSTAVFRIENGVGHAELFSGDASSLTLNDEERADYVQHSSVGQHRMTFDPTGLPLREIYEPLQGGEPVADANGVAGRAFAYDQAGNLSEIRNLGLDGRPDQTAGKAVMMSFTYDRRGESVSFEFRSATGVLVAGPEGVARFVFVRDRYGNVVEFRTFDANGAPVGLGNWGSPRRTRTYDEHGNVVEERAFDANNNPSYDGAERVSIGRYRYDEHGRQIEGRYFDVAGAPVMGRLLLAAATRQEYDSSGHLIAEHAFDGSGRPTPAGVSGAATVRYHFDGRGNLSEQAYYGPDGRLVHNAGGFAIERFAYDDQNRVLRVRWYAPDNSPTTTTAGVFGDNYAYDNHGNTAQVIHVGSDGRPLANVWGVASQRLTYDETGRLIQTRNFDANGFPVIDTSSGAASERFSYDPQGRLIESASYGISGEPIIIAEIDAHARQRAYDARGFLIRETDLGRTRNVLGFSTYVSDDRGRPTSITAWLPDYAPTTHGAFNGAHGVHLVYDAHGQITSTVYLLANGQPGPDRDGVTERRSVYDARGNLVEERTLDGAGFLVFDANLGAAISRFRYDGAGRMIATQNFDAFDRMIDTMQITRDAMGRIIRIETRYSSGAFEDIGGVAVRAFDYAQNGRCTRELAYNAAGQLARDRAIVTNDQCPHDTRGRS